MFNIDLLKKEDHSLIPKNFSSFTHWNNKGGILNLYPCSIATNFENWYSSVYLLRVFNIFDTVIKSTADGRLLQKFSTIGFVWYITRNRLEVQSDNIFFGITKYSNNINFVKIIGFSLRKWINVPVLMNKRASFNE